MKAVTKWVLPKPITPVEPDAKIEVKINDEIVLQGDAKATMDYFAKTLTEHHHKALFKRNVTQQGITLSFRIVLLVVVVAFYPEIMSVLVDLKNAFMDIGR